MKKTPTIFKRDPSNMRKILNEAHPACAWVFAGEGVATRKYDGTCCMVQDGLLYRRRELKPGQPIPDDFVRADHDDETGKTVGWIPCSLRLPEDEYHMEAMSREVRLLDGTYELLGPKVQGNPERFLCHQLLAHRNAETYDDVPRDYNGLREWLQDKDIEGLVFHHPDGRMAKIKKRDFGLHRGNPKTSES